jgi:hypothetical protein
VGVFYGFFVADAGEAEALDYDAYAFVVEVCHDDYGIFVSCYSSVKRAGTEGESNIPLKP